MVIRLILTAVVLAILGVASFGLTTASTLVLGNVAGSQFQNSDAYPGIVATFHSTYAVRNMIDGVLVILLIAIWFKYIRAKAKELFKVLAIILIAGSLSPEISNSQAWAFAEKADKTEAYTILPNESAFWIPSVGANKDSQAQLDSEQYLKDNKVSSKLFIVPHTKLAGSGGTSWIGSDWDIYIPAGRLIVVDRTPYSREWVAQAERGTAARDQGQHCQSKEGLNITTGISIGASVSEGNAAKFLYRFGVVPSKGNRNDIQYMFASVYYGRSLSEVMEDVVRAKVQTLVCNEFAVRNFDQANNDSKVIIDTVEKETRDYLASVGVTLDFIGWADTFTFDPLVQKAINDRYTALALKDSTATLEALAQLKVQEGIAAGVAAHGLPSIIPSNIMDALSGLWRSKQPAAN